MKVQTRYATTSGDMLRRGCKAIVTDIAYLMQELRHPELDGTDQLLYPKDRFEMGEQP